jgi:hypothetical protein
LNDELVKGHNAKEDCPRVEVIVNDDEDEMRNVPAATEIAEDKTEDEGKWFQS